jgi:hypothetical protein
VNRASIQWSTTTVSIPDATISWASSSPATTAFQSGQWVTSIPSNFTGSPNYIWMGGVTYTVPATLAVGTALKYTACVSTDHTGYGITWWTEAGDYPAARVPSDMNALNVKVVYSTTLDAYHNTDLPGTPEAIKSFLQTGGTGGGYWGGVPVTPVLR